MIDAAPTGQQLLAAIIESSDDGIVSKDLNGIVTSWNRGAERIFGYTPGEMIGRPISVLAPPDRRDEMPTILARIRRGERIDHYETVRCAKDGRLVNISLTVSPIVDESGKIIGASKICRDITERKLAEQTILQQTERLSRSNADLQQFAYVASHDLQEPLRMIASFSELLKVRYGGKLDAEADEFISYVVSGATRMSALIGDLLSYSRVTNADEIPMAPVAVREVVSWALENLHLAIRESGAVVEIGDLPTVTGERINLTQVFQNLISNAIKYRGPSAPLVKIDARADGPNWVFSIADNGIGIAPAYHEAIFGLFKRLHAEDYAGTGIGLAVCKRIIERHRGRIWVESAPGEGSTFRFTLPREEPHAG
jgi:PAS domain S-box-containing protein